MYYFVGTGLGKTYIAAFATTAVRFQASRVHEYTDGGAFSAVLLGSGSQAGVDGDRLEGGELEFAEHAHNEDMGGIESLVDLEAGFADDEEYAEVCGLCFLLCCMKPVLLR